ncbi:serine/threonine-protein phosphatase PGAM5 [Tropilaelaps mercedesae]|uniref:Serine/threonine-protein phosphatase PGAM5, mitochondrial n=1 Tax=Tropilaelaps mercedesae TaxID=418985 RepID=A0A1V9XPG5_9ACAR|nr:serine/threonine-protein phosphatase PGAM5 [Tropilaelaps mercedesae]
MLKIAGTLIGVTTAAYVGLRKWNSERESKNTKSEEVLLGQFTKPSALQTQQRSYTRSALGRSSATGNNNEVKKWDYNWDRRDPAEIYFNKDGRIDVCNIPHKSRHIYLVRHGEYDQTDSNDNERKLTEKGRQQATLAGKRLNELGLKFDKIVISTMTRAQETGEQILKELPPEMAKRVSFTDMLREGSPCPSQPESGKFHEPSRFFQDGARIEAAFRKYFYRAKPSQEKTERVLLVCHANVIRYFLFRALQLPEDGWHRFSIQHASITHIEIKPSGRVVARAVGETNFMPDELIKR